MGYQVAGQQKQKVLERDGGKCQYCGKPAKDIDHIMPYSETQDSSPENLVTCCPSCNKYGNNKVFATFEEKRAYILGRRNGGRGRKRILDRGTVNDFFAPIEPKRPPSPYDVKYERHTYRVKPETHEAIREMAEKNGVGINDLVRWILCQALDKYGSGELVLPVEEYAVTKSRLTE